MEQSWKSAKIRDHSLLIGTARYELTAGICKALSSETYGVSITLQKKDGTEESAVVPDVCCTRSGAQALLQMLCEHTVTPVTLRDVVEDYLAAL